LLKNCVSRYVPQTISYGNTGIVKTLRLLLWTPNWCFD